MTREQSLLNTIKRLNKEIRELRSDNNLLGLQKTEFENLYNEMKLNKKLMKIEKIDKETENGAFEIAFRDGNWGLNPEQILPLFKALIKRHNEMVDLVNNNLLNQNK